VHQTAKLREFSTLAVYLLFVEAYLSLQIQEVPIHKCSFVDCMSTKQYQTKRSIIDEREVVPHVFGGIPDACFGCFGS
jgi:hypothetical protein